MAPKSCIFTPEDVLGLILGRGALLGVAVTPLALLAVALAASYLPARRATRVDPVPALRRG